MEKFWDHMFILFKTCGIVDLHILFVILYELPEYVST
jgi:hypothetical protein